jgi:lipopolysaccharide biosynthesis glycosyltransferase
MIHFPGKEKPWDFDRYNYLRLFVSMLVRGKFDRLIYKTFIWKKYRDLCDRK